MRFKIDENLPVEVAELLRAEGHDAITVHDQELSGASDPRIAAVCRGETRAIITLDTDFATIQAYPPALYPGLIVLQLRRQDKPYVLQICSRLVPLFAKEPLERHLWIVEDRRMRIRG